VCKLNSKQGARAPEIKKASVETDASKCAQPGGLWQGLTGRTVVVGAILTAAVVTTETTATATMVTATASIITAVETALFTALALLLGATLILALAFWTGTELLWATIFTTVVTAITATTASTAMGLAATVATAIAAFVATTFAGAFVLTWGRCSHGLLSRVTGEKAFQPAKETRLFGFDDGGCGLRLKRALLTTFAKLLFALTELFAAFA
jgi:hypothetical protein